MKKIEIAIDSYRFPEIRRDLIDAGISFTWIESKDGFVTYLQAEMEDENKLAKIITTSVRSVIVLRGT